MNKNLIIMAGTFAAISAMTYTTSVVSKENKALAEITISSVEALSENEMNSLWEWFSQGIRKNEREWIRPCPSEESSSGSANIGAGNGGTTVGGGVSGSHEQTNPSGRDEITCPYGEENCTEVEC